MSIKGEQAEILEAVALETSDIVNRPVRELKFPKGALIGALIVGETRSIGIVFFPEIELPLLFLIAVIILAVKPEGLFGEK